MAKKTYPWQGKVTNHTQIGGIELATLENGAARGTRVANINTGSGLRYKVVIDRACDIADAFFNQHSLCWLSHGGITAPSPEKKPGLEWLYTFGGGLVTTCGLSHVGAPDSQNGLHGRISNIPAELVSIIQPDIAAGKLDMSVTAVMRESKVFGPSLELKRTISSNLNEPAVRIHDVVTNRGNTPSPLKLMYHCNFGWPLVDAGAEIFCSGKWVSAGREIDGTIFNNKNDFRKVPQPLDSHKGTGEACAFVDPKPDKKGICTAGIYNRKLGLEVTLKFSKKQLPWVTNWQHWGKGEYVTGLEPGTNPPFDNGEKNIFLKPQESRSFELEISVKHLQEKG